MFRNAYYNSYKSTMYLWEQIDNKNLFEEIHFVPYLYVDDPDGETKDINGTPVSKKTFKTYTDFYNYQAENPNAKENNMKPEIQFLAERYYKIPDEDIIPPKMKIYSIDIEVHMGDNDTSFPHANEAKVPVVLISVNSINENKTTTFGLKEYNGKYKGEDWLTYVHCKDEEALLISFFNFMHKNSPDVITGWNVTQFDTLYLITRAKRLFGEDDKTYTKLSPINVVKVWNKKESKDVNIDLGGVTILDYLELYKWYSPTKLERYTLEYVSNYELENGKVDYSAYNDLRQLYYDNWDLYVEYNIVDALRVGQLEAKLGYIKLIQTIAMLTKCPMKFFNTQTTLIEGMLLTYMRRNNLCAPAFYGGVQEGFEAAWVKEPQKGLHDWVIDLDITSSYPTAIITLNMSVETYYGRILGITEDQMMLYVSRQELPEFDMLKDSGKVHFDGKRLATFNSALKKRLLCIAPCGSVFSTSVPGVISTVERQAFTKRIEIKGKMNKMKRTLKDLRGDNLIQTEEKIARYHGLQNALKIILNSMYGILAVPFTRYFNKNIAEAVVSCGRQTIKASEKIVNELLNKPTDELLKLFDECSPKDNVSKEKEDFVLYGDTDSLYINVGAVLKRYTTYMMNDESIIEATKQLATIIENYVNNRAYKEVQRKAYNSAETDFRIKFKQEIIAKTVLFVKKKKYSCWIIDEEGAQVDKIKTTGLEIVRSDTPELVRPMLKQAMNMILKKHPDKELIAFVAQCRKELQVAVPEQLATNIGVHDTTKYIESDFSCKKGTPMQVKGVANYRNLLKQMKLTGKYEDITEGGKVKVVYVKKNTLNMESISFLRWPSEFDKVVQIDIEKMITKTLLNKLSILLEPMNKVDLLNGKAKETLNLFFGAKK